MKTFIFLLFFGVEGITLECSAYSIKDTAIIVQKNDSAWIELQDGNYQIANIHLLQSKEISEQINFPEGLVICYKRLAILYFYLCNYEQSLKYNFSAIRIYETLKNDEGVFGVFNNVGLIYKELKQYDKSLEFYFKAMGMKNDKSMTYNNIGTVYLEMSDYNVALSYFYKCIRMAKKYNNLRSESKALGNIGFVYNKKNMDIEAIKWHSKALYINENLSDDQSSIYSISNIAESYCRLGKYSISLNFLKKCKYLCDKIGSLDGLLECEKNYMLVYAQLNDCHNELYHRKLFTLYKDSIFNKDLNEKITRSELKFYFEKKESLLKDDQIKQNVFHQYEINKQKIIKNYILGVCILALLFSIFLYNNFRTIKKSRNIIQLQKKIVEEKSKETIDNINYAQKIQQSMFPSQSYLASNFPEHLLIFSPKDTVSGDFYFAHKKKNEIYFLTADATSHGVCGAMTSIIGCSLINEIIIHRNINTPDIILNTLRTEVIRALNPEGSLEERKEGMDVSICKISLDTLILESAGANNPIFITRNDELIEIKPNRMPVGLYYGEFKSFDLNITQLKKGDCIFSFSDGIQDQFSECTNKKFMKKRLKELLISIQYKSMGEQKRLIIESISAWKGNSEQTDDIVIFGIKI